MSLRVVLMGTGSFAVPAFRAVLESPHEVPAVVTQPDRRNARGQVYFNPVKELARGFRCEVFQPENVNAPESLQRLRSLNADLFLVAAYGQILSPELLEIPRLGAINLHASLLPRHRGAAPVHHAIWAGDTETGVTVFKIEPQVDAGPIIAARRLAIRDEETAGELEARLAELAAPLTLEVLEQLEAGTATFQPQDPARATRAPRLKKEHGRIDWTQPADRIARQVRALQPWPRAYTYLIGSARPVRVILKAARAQQVSEPAPTESMPCGTVLPTHQDRLFVQTGRGVLEILRIQPEGRRSMSAADFIHGYRIKGGERFGEEHQPVDARGG